MKNSTLLKTIADLQVIASSAALILSMFLPWFTYVYEGAPAGATRTVTQVLWQTYESYAGLLVAVAFAALASAIISLTRERDPDAEKSPRRLDLPILLAAVAAAVMTWWKTRFPGSEPEFGLLEMNRAWGLYLGAIAAFLLVDGAVLRLIFGRWLQRG